MNRPPAREADHRVPVALGLLALILTLIGSQHVSAGTHRGTDRPVAMTFAAASPAP
jgi:hypothetical protein